MKLRVEILSKAIHSEPYNTTNGWGFAGSFGTRYVFSNGVELYVGKYQYRHAGTEPYFSVYDAEGRKLFSGTSLTEFYLNKISGLIN